MVPSLDEVIECQLLPLPVEVFSVHVAPESVEVQMFPTSTAASLVPSLDEVMDCQLLPLPVEVFSVHVSGGGGGGLGGGGLGGVTHVVSPLPTKLSARLLPEGHNVQVCEMTY